jgi:hypothetical protein
LFGGGKFILSINCPKEDHLLIYPAAEKRGSSQGLIQGSVDSEFQSIFSDMLIKFISPRLAKTKRELAQVSNSFEIVVERQFLVESTRRSCI